MTLASATPKYFRLQPVVPMIIQGDLVTSGDCVAFPECKGVVNIKGSIILAGTAVACIATDLTYVYGSALVNGSAYDATTTAIVVDAITVVDRKVPFYVKTNYGEYMLVTADSAAHTTSATWTVLRGQLGTTAAAGTTPLGGVQDNAPLQIMNEILITSSPGSFTIYACPLDAGTPFKTTPR